MSNSERIPFDADVAIFADWLSRNFPSLPRDRRQPVELADVFKLLQHRGNKRDAWFDVLWLKVQALRADGATWNAATKRALTDWNERAVELPALWRSPSESHLLNLVQRLKNKKESVIDLGINQVTASHFWISLVYGEFTIAARLHRGAKPRLKTEIQSQIRNMLAR